MKLLVATTNSRKVGEIRAILDALPWLDLESLTDYPGLTEAEETGTTFAQNARIKAQAYAAATGELTVSEDSGLEIDALDGEPGVQSARFNGESYPEKFAVIERMLAGRGTDSSAARFIAALALVTPARVMWETTGIVEGRLRLPARGTGGFGYDPIFFYPPYGRVLAEVSPEEKTAVSHRGQAFRQLHNYLQQAFELTPHAQLPSNG